MNKAVIDTSSLVYAWDNYPIGKFPTVWVWLGELINSNHIIIFEVVKDEIKSEKSPDLYNWISKHTEYKRTSEIETRAKEIEENLGIIDGVYGKGVKKGDIRIIAFAAIKEMDVITNESPQEVNRGSQPPEKKNYRIPRACKEVGIKNNYDFLTLLKKKLGVF